MWAPLEPKPRCLTSRRAASPQKQWNTRLHQPHNGWAEQDPADWWNAAAESIRAVVKKSGVRAGEIIGVGLSGQMHGLVMLDSDGRPLRRAILWCDQRTGRECADLEAEMGRSRLIDITANPAMTGFTAAKILWVKRHEPGVFRPLRAHPPAEGLHTVLPDRCVCHRGQRCFRACR